MKCVARGFCGKGGEEISYGDINRSYTKTGARLGARAEYFLGSRLAFTARFLDSLEINSQPQVLTASLGLRYRLSESVREAIYLHFRLGNEVLDYMDRRLFPNHVHVEYKSLASVGLSASI